MNRSLQHSAFIVAFALLSPFTLAQQSLGPPSCDSSGAPGQATKRPLTQRPSADSIQAAADAESADPSVLTATEPANFGIARFRLQDYDDCVGTSGCYWADLDAQTRRADVELTRLLAEHHATTPEEARKQKLAMVLDIDETSLSSYCEEKREDFGYIPSMFQAWIVSPEASIPIPGTLRLYNHAIAAGVSVFFITGRPGKGAATDQTAATARNLHTAGFDGWQELILHGMAYPVRDTAMYKSDARASILKKGYRILLNVGDQWSDLRDTADPRLPDRGATKAEISVKLPNPFYYLP